jgi:sortase (surface protein transpeptidase)
VSTELQRRLSWLAVVAGIALAIALALWLAGQQQRVGQGENDAQSASGTPAPRHKGVPPRPRLEIPAIDVSAHAVDLGLRPNGTLEVPKDYSTVGLWKHGPAPGERGPALIAGHADSRKAPAVFYRLRRLRRGDRIRWEGENGVTAQFVVTRTEEHRKTAFPTSRVYGRTRRPELRLVTCSGPPDASGRRSLNNLIVFARRV